MNCCRFVLDEHLKDHKEAGIIVGTLDREGPKWHFKPMAEYANGGLGEIATKFGIIVQE